MKSINKFYRTVFVFLALLFVSIMQAVACDVNMEVVQGKKEKYSKGDEVVVRVTVMLTHRNCPEGINSTKFNPEGLEILSATRWTEKSTGVWERRMKLKITENKPDSKLVARRTCDKEGGLGVLTLSTK